MLDGQQRINALFSMFTESGQYGRFYLHMTARRASPDGTAIARRTREQAVRYIHGQDESEANREVPERDRHVHLNRWYAWAERGPQGAVRRAQDAISQNPAEAMRILNEIDPDFADSLEQSEMETAAARLQRLCEVWEDRMIPVQRLELGSPMHVLEVFTRINRAGVQVAGDDLFFAAVKTVWPQAEEIVAGVVQQLLPASEGERVAPLVGRVAALRILARLAARAAGQADLVPLTVDRLNGARGQEVIVGMQALGDPDRQPLQRMRAAVGAIAQSSAIGFGLYSVDERLWDHVLGWAALNPHALDARWLQTQLPAIDAYLLGATVFRYPSLLRDPFSRLALTEALVAGAQGNPFPVERIIEVARGQIPELQRGRTRVPSAGAAEDRLRLADSHPGLILSVVQSIPYRPRRPFDWDHIFPQAKGGLMWTPGLGGQRRHHKHRHLIGSAGNLWGLDAEINRTAQDDLPAAKFDLIENDLNQSSPRVWPKSQWWLTTEEIREFKELGPQLESRKDVDGTMDRFQVVVVGRALRMVDEVFRRFPMAQLFAADANVSASEPSRQPAISDALGLELAEVETAAEPPSDGSMGERVERVLQLAEERAAGAALRNFLSRALSMGLQARGYQWTVTITPPKTKAVALIALTPGKEDGLIRTWVAPAAFAEHFPDVARERFDEVLGGIRGVPFDDARLSDLADRLERLLGGRAASASKV